MCYILSVSASKLEEIRCPCGEIFEAELWNAINASDDPELKEELLAGEINVVCCPVCGQLFYAEHFLLYQDSAAEILAFIYPSSFISQASHCMARMQEDFGRAMAELPEASRISYEPILLFGLDTLVELIHEENEELDEVSILQYAARKLHLSLIWLHPSLSRPLQIPRLLPIANKKNATLREQIIAGLSCLLEYNTHLSRYRKFLETVNRNKQWKLDKQLVKKKLNLKSH
ncbi:MAG: hypothetical protein A2314_08325 [Elusimicrobia bacterium RIFOXYB2_FULL_50_12]|nr:MAG: hypothetical protein A2314_08325 [Elusimicrobia bacterium RIFOXYB2_FULL_50_12]